MSSDPRAFAERTALAWNRTGLSLAVVGALALRAGQRGGLLALGEGLAALLWACAAGAWLYGSSLYRRRTVAEDPPLAERERALGLLTLATVVVAAAALALALLD